MLINQVGKKQTHYHFDSNQGQHTRKCCSRVWYGPFSTIPLDKDGSSGLLSFPLGQNKAEWQWKKYQLCTQNSSMQENYEKKKRNISNVWRTSEAYARKSKQHDLHYRSCRARWAFFFFCLFFPATIICRIFSLLNYFHQLFVKLLVCSIHYWAHVFPKMRPENCFVVASVVNSERLHSKSHWCIHKVPETSKGQHTHKESQTQLLSFLSCFYVRVASLTFIKANFEVRKVFFGGHHLTISWQAIDFKIHPSRHTACRQEKDTEQSTCYPDLMPTLESAPLRPILWVPGALESLPYSSVPVGMCVFLLRGAWEHFVY